MRRRTRTRCEGETADDFDCPHPASRIGEWAAGDQPVIRIPLCRGCARRKARAGWTVQRAGRAELARLAHRRAGDDPGGTEYPGPDD
jgi:hypothetical protein